VLTGTTRYLVTYSAAKLLANLSALARISPPSVFRPFAVNAGAGWRQSQTRFSHGANPSETKPESVVEKVFHSQASGNKIRAASGTGVSPVCSLEREALLRANLLPQLAGQCSALRF
jgi:hypothetical protein